MVVFLEFGVDNCSWSFFLLFFGIARTYFSWCSWTEVGVWMSIGCVFNFSCDWGVLGIIWLFDHVAFLFRFFGYVWVDFGMEKI